MNIIDLIYNSGGKIIFIITFIFLLVVGRRLLSRVATNNASARGEIVKGYVNKGEQWCLRRIAMTSEKEVISHLRSALRRIEIANQNKATMSKS